eukprot:54562-Eustigmatos_ZCMA.PRE.1
MELSPLLQLPDAVLLASPASAVPVELTVEQHPGVLFNSAVPGPLSDGWGAGRGRGAGALCL